MLFVNPFGTSSEYMKLVAADLGLDLKNAHSLLEGTGLDLTKINNDHERIDARSLIRMYENASRLSHHAVFNLHMGELFQLSTHGTFGLALQTAPDLLGALRILVRYACIREDFIRYRLERHREGVALLLRSARPADPVSEPLMELMLSMTFQMITNLIGHHSRDIRISATYPAPQHSEFYRDYFNCSIRFSADSDEILIPDHLLNLPCFQSDARMHESSMNHCHTIYRQLEASLDIQARVGTVMEFDEAALSLHQVAQQLGLSTRTLSRKLQKANVSFQSIRDNHLRQLAATMLADTGMTLDDIGYRLGYDNAANFRRAFLRWFGQTPSSYRQSLR